MKFQKPLLLTVLALVGGFGCLAAQADVLKGGVQAEDWRHPSAPSLNRNDIKTGGDPFSSGNDNSNQEQTLEPPKGAFDIQSEKPPKPPPSLNGNAQQGSEDQFAPQSQTPSEDNSGGGKGPLIGAAQQEQIPAAKSNDPDDNPDMQLQWDAWHQRVAAAIYQRFSTMAHTAFKFSRPLGAYVSYVVTRDGRIVNVQLQQKSSNIMFNTMLLMVINSLNGQSQLLAFPQGSNRNTVEKGGMFTQNYGMQGFKFTTGDRETVHNK
jgi:TonB C terminal